METVLIYVLIPAAIYGVIALLTLRPRSARVPRYRPGQPWAYEPVWWNADPGHVRQQQEESTKSTPANGSVRTARGGARGNW